MKNISSINSMRSRENFSRGILQALSRMPTDLTKSPCRKSLAKGTLRRRLLFSAPTSKVPICGRTTIAAHYVRAKELNLKNNFVY